MNGIVSGDYGFKKGHDLRNRHALLNILYEIPLYNH